jgi:hypothetical protein
MADRGDGLFDAVGRNDQMGEVERGFVDRGRLIELRVGTGDLSECFRGRRQIGAKEDGFGAVMR